MTDFVLSPSSKSKDLAAPATESTRARILDATASLIRQKGFKATTVRDIGTAVGLYSGSLFHYFKSKDEILMEIMRAAFISICTRHEQALALPLTPLEKLRRFIWQEVDLVFMTEEGDYHAVLYFDWRDVSPKNMPELIQLRKRYFSSWTEVVQQCHDAGHLKGDPAISVRIIEATLRGMMSWYRPDGRYDPHQVTDEIILILAR
ncbi:TetR/AcrR family transcriptional regulator [Alcaligenaceae bacterium]|nr:TetR/AcrR family transcriptional regulator [Alcaligenaceae bacterium]